MVYELWQDDIKEKSLPCSQPFRLEDILTSEVETTQWASEGLPGDELSIQNGILTTRSSRFPLCIDPQMQAITWIKKKEGKELEGKVKTFKDSDFLKKLELAITYGGPFLFENLDEYIDPVIDPVLNKQLVPNESGKLCITLGENEIEWDESFRLYMTSKVSNPSYGPEVGGRTSIINYSVTQQGLQAQLLNVTVRHERLDLEERREELIKDMSQNKALLKKLEDTLMHELSNATGNILDNEELINTLEETKLKATEIAEKLEKAQETAEEIDVVRSRYTPAAKRGAVLFFVMDSLSAILNMYEYSLAAFLTVFDGSLAKSKKDSNLDVRLRNIIEALTFNVYNYTCLGLFEKHKLMFSFQMTIKLLEADGKLNRKQLDFFLKGNLSLEKSDRQKPYDWIPDQGWEDLVQLAEQHKDMKPSTDIKAKDVEEVHPLATILDSVEKNEKAWKEYYNFEAPEDEKLPEDLTYRLNIFEQLLLLRCFRVDRVTVGVTKYVIEKMSEKYVLPPVLDYSRIYDQKKTNNLNSQKLAVEFVTYPPPTHRIRQNQTYPKKKKSERARESERARATVRARARSRREKMKRTRSATKAVQQKEQDAESQRARAPPPSPRLEDLRFLSLFTGLGSLEYGLLVRGVLCVAVCEREPKLELYAANQAKERTGHDPVRLGDTGKPWRPEGDLPSFSLVSAGPPCTNITPRGDCSGAAGFESGLVHDVFKFIDYSTEKNERGPKFLVLENVAGATTHPRNFFSKAPPKVWEDGECTCHDEWRCWVSVVAHEVEKRGWAGWAYR
ncbi:heavy chain alpha of dynein [Chloropicon roscoffensis]|uniref:Heavy chain alpha of dynein n=1 Tax=Chloropicon roscoffensis TaxID=1461544 RepID=A0AAX4P7W3_9CHLO